MKCCRKSNCCPSKWNRKSRLSFLSVWVKSPVAINLSMLWMISMKSSVVLSLIWATDVCSANERNRRKNNAVSMFNWSISIFCTRSFVWINVKNYLKNRFFIVRIVKCVLLTMPPVVYMCVMLKVFAHTKLTDWLVQRWNVTCNRYKMKMFSPKCTCTFTFTPIEVRFSQVRRNSVRHTKQQAQHKLPMMQTK